MIGLELKDFNNAFEYLTQKVFKSKEELTDFIRSSIPCSDFVIDKNFLSISHNKETYNYQLVEVDNRIYLLGKWSRQAK